MTKSVKSTKKPRKKPAPRSSGVGVYQNYAGAFPSTDPRRSFMNDFRPLSTTADQAIAYNLSFLLPQCRQVLRSSPSAKGLWWGFKSDIVGSGIAVEPDTGNPALNDQIKRIWSSWCEDLTPDHRSLWELQQQASGEWFAAGAALWKIVAMPQRAAQGLCPLVIIPYEVELLTIAPVANMTAGAFFVRGVELDGNGQPLAYHLADYDLVNSVGIMAGAFTGPGNRVPAEEIIHGYRQDRPRQTHGEPMLAACLERITQEEDAVLIELQAAKVSAVPAGVLKSAAQAASVVQDYNGGPAMPNINLKGGVLVRLAPGDDFETVVNNRPTEKLAPFRNMTRGDLAAATASSKQWMDRDPSRANYSASRMDELLSERCRGPILQTFAKYHASEPYKRILPYILLALGITIPTDPVARQKIFAHKVLPDKMKYVDPVKDAQASRMAVENGLSTVEIEAAAIGRDASEVRKQRLAEQIQSDADKLTRLVAIDGAVRKAKEADPDLVVTMGDVLAIGGADTDPVAFADGGAPPAKPDAASAPPDEESAVPAE